MSIFIDPEARHRIYIRDLGIDDLADSEDWVEIYMRMPAKVQMEIQRAGLLPVRMNDPEARIDVAAGLTALLRHSLVTWSWPRTIDDRNVGLIRADVSTALALAINAHYGVISRTEEEKKSFTATGTGTDGRQAARRAGGSADGEGVV